jgi:tol-pal system protein YbgF
MKSPWFRIILYAVLVSAALALTGCGTVQEGTYEEEQYNDATPVSKTAMLEYRIDSLARENQKLQQQLEHASVENKNLSARNSELESKVTGGGSPSSTPSAPPTPTRMISNPAYDNALAKFRNKNYQDAIDEFSALLTSGISDDLMDNCRYWIGESYFAQRKYADAVQQFESVVAIPGSDKADDAQLMIGIAHATQGNKAAARQAYQSRISSFPSSPLVKRARAKMNAL